MEGIVEDVPMGDDHIGMRLEDQFFAEIEGKIAVVVGIQSCVQQFFTQGQIVIAVQNDNRLSTLSTEEAKCVTHDAALPPVDLRRNGSRFMLDQELLQHISICNEEINFCLQTHSCNSAQRLHILFFSQAEAAGMMVGGRKNFHRKNKLSLYCSLVNSTAIVELMP